MRPTQLIAAISLLAAPAAADEVLTVYAPDYFGSEWGPGPAIEEAFEARCGCDLQYRIGELMPRLLLEGARTEADVAIGFNTDVTKRARETGLLAPHGVDTTGLTMPVEWTDDVFLPFNWGYTAFVYDRTRVDAPPASFDELVTMPEDVSIVIQDPRSSISGLALVLWVEAVYGEGAPAFWEAIEPRILTVTRGWSEAYGLFTSGEADMVLSYTTSPAYHLIAEDDDTKRAAIFDEGHYLMVEVAAKLAGTDDPALADDFMEFVLSPEFQSIIPTANWAYPAKLPREEWPEAFERLGIPDRAIVFDEDEAAALRDAAIEDWRQALR